MSTLPLTAPPHRPFVSLSLLLGLGLCLPLVGWSATVQVAWNLDRPPNPDTLYLLRIVSAVQGQARVTERLIGPLPAQQCTDWEQTPAPPAMLCAELCLDPGEYSLTLRTTQGKERSPDTNVVDLTVEAGLPCNAPTPPAKASNNAAPLAGAVAGAAVVAGAVAVSTASSGPASIPALVNLGCVTWKVVGPCMCNPFTPCVTVEYFEPGWMIEVVKKPGDSLIPLTSDILQAALSSAGVPPFGGGGASNTPGSGRTNLHYSEVHVYSFPQLWGGPCTSCAPAPQFSLHYASEADPQWKIDIAVPSPLDLVRQIGVWARLYPRAGKVITSSAPVASGVQAYRGMDIAFNPVGEPPNTKPHTVFQPTGGTSSCFQMAWPKMTFCMPGGTPPPLWETASVSPSGKYAWIAWRRRVCCVNPNNTTCGLTIIGGHGANTCLLPSIPTP